MANTAVQYDTRRNGAQTVLLVDDDRTLRAVLGMQLEQLGYDVIEASNGSEACEMLESHLNDIDIILLDREMPVMDGMQFIARIKNEARFARVPVIMVTGSGQPSQVSEGIAAGVFYYLVKPIHNNVLSTIVSTAMREAQRIKKIMTILEKQDNSFTLLTRADFSINTINEAEYLSGLLANCFADKEKVLPGLSALMINAIEHGNLSIGFEEKDRLMAQNGWADEINRRLMLPENIHKEVNITYEKTALAQSVKITDAGAGFDWRSFLKIDPARTTSGSGRGIATALTKSFDQVIYNEKGNEVTAIVLNKTGS